MLEFDILETDLLVNYRVVTSKMYGYIYACIYTIYE